METTGNVSEIDCSWSFHGVGRTIFVFDLGCARWTCSFNDPVGIDAILAVPVTVTDDAVKQEVWEPFETLRILAASRLLLQEEAQLAAAEENHCIDQLSVCQMVKIEVP